ncbi:MarR family winged helix-turn-helix transcriptional regulator [Cohnella silvisoli]|uniref:MarR family transcriptional regulator n=1 Tax=Cohnella silvisoli TaxID=2873699 RepID=A0ABV1KQ80_9BACL|nr:MarR family transcriptional regulator [Cohnella silvisoli]MCD9022117.1 MarR family transcriptional regulator [Cohnella silvisoli]
MNDNEVIVYKLRQIKNMLSGYLVRVLPQYGITPIMMYTIEFLRRNAEAKAVDVANEFGLTRGAVTQLLDKLEEQGLVIRKPHPTSRRSLQIHITNKGNELVDAILNAYNQEIDKLIKPYSSDDLALLRQLLDKLPL